MRDRPRHKAKKSRATVDSDCGVRKLGVTACTTPAHCSLFTTNHQLLLTMPPSTLTLKQRLANLANATSSPSAPHSLSSSHSFSSNASSSLSSAAGQGRSVSAPLSFQQMQTSRRKPLPFFNTPWTKNGGGRGAIAIDGVEETRRVEEVLAQMIFQAGVDYECVVINVYFFLNRTDGI